MRYRFVDEALAEFIAAGKFYNERAPGLGETFVDEVQAGVQVILKDPEVWRVISEDVRRYLVQRFPYGIYYTIENDLVVIWAIRHLHRDPDYWQKPK